MVLKVLKQVFDLHLFIVEDYNLLWVHLCVPQTHATGLYLRPQAVDNRSSPALCTSSFVAIT